MSTNKPMPARTDISAPFWDGLKSGRVTLPRCRSCGHWIFYPRRHCDACWSHDLEWQDVSGAGSLYTYTLTRIPTLPDFADEMPQALAVVELDQGVRINTTLVGLAEDEIRVGMRLKPVFDQVGGDGTTLLRFTGVDKTIAPPLPDAPAAEAPPVAVTRVAVSDEAALRALVGEAFTAWSNEVVVDQALIDEFARLSGDDYWIHTDPDKARRSGPFGGTIAHGYLTLSLVPYLGSQVFALDTPGAKLNYGVNKVRFPNPVRVGSRVRAHVALGEVTDVPAGKQLTLRYTIEIEGEAKPACVAETVVLLLAG